VGLRGLSQGELCLHTVQSLIASQNDGPNVTVYKLSLGMGWGLCGPGSVQVLLFFT
jgi:hypothetical protein